MCFSFALKTRYCFYSSPLLLTSLTVWFLQSQIPKGLFPPFVLLSELPLPSSVITYMKATFNSKPLSPSLWVRQGLLLSLELQSAFLRPSWATLLCYPSSTSNSRHTEPLQHLPNPLKLLWTMTVSRSVFVGHQDMCPSLGACVFLPSFLCLPQRWIQHVRKIPRNN